MRINNAIFNVVILIVLTAFFLGAYLLENLGVQYVSEGGTPLLKIHVYSYLIMATVFICLLKFGIKGYVSALGEFKQAWLRAFGCIVFVILYGLYKQGMSGMAYLVDFIFTPLLFVPILLSLTNKQKHFVITLLAYLILFNACLAIVEFSFSYRLIAVEFTSFSHFRSTALLTHPLNNALITASLTMLLMDKTRLPSIVYFFIVFIALFAFGGRGSTAIFLFAFALLTLPTIHTFFIKGVVMSKLRFALYQAGLCVAAFAAVIALTATPIGDRILSKMYVDNSATARFKVFDFLERMSSNEFLFGASQSSRENIKFFSDINVIENYLVGWIANFGLLGLLLLVAGVFLLPITMARRMDSKALLSMFILFFASITNNALSTKTITVLLMLTVITCLVQQVKLFSPKEAR
ncbi:MAG: VpsF family polysaccharide biosynthesis protein [Colwellia sp.]|jgi:hypothetical protein